MNVFSTRVKNLIKKNNISQKEISIEFNIPITTINGYVNGNRNPDFETLKLFANYFNVSVDYLLGREDNPSNTLGYELEGVYFDLAKEAQEKGLSPSDVRKIINLYEAFKREENDAKNSDRD